MNPAVLTSPTRRPVRACSIFTAFVCWIMMFVSLAMLVFIIFTQGAAAPEFYENESSATNGGYTVNEIPSLSPPPPGPLSSSHKLYKNETTPQIFCGKCHSASVANVSSGVHRLINCLCHGYNPNQIAQYNVNEKHNLTRNIYCTNCHTKYNETTGDITIGPGVSGKNQSAHYLIRNKTDPALYNNSRGFFNT
jgi:hypothetical protein